MTSRSPLVRLAPVALLLVAPVALLLAAALLITPRPAEAGCGCDHPPPGFAPVMPPFASATKLVTLFAEGDLLTPGAVYEVKFEDKRTYAIAEQAGSLRAVMPHGVKPGPTEIHVKGPGYDHKYAPTLFTALPNPVKLPGHGGAFRVHKLKTAVAEDGTLLLPVDLSRIHEPTQFALMFRGLALDFGRDDVVLYNADGVDLTIFTLAVADSTERRWGSYYGWDVEDDAGLRSIIYDHKVGPAKHEDRDSDVFTYWRHEFHTYAAAHAPGGSHEVDGRGLHPDGTVHIDHDQLVIAIAGSTRPDDLVYQLTKLDLRLQEDLQKADEEYHEHLAKAEGDPEKRAEAEKKRAEDVAKAEAEFETDRRKLLGKMERLKGGDQDVDVALLAIESLRPVEPGEVVDEISGSLTVEELEVE